MGSYLESLIVEYGRLRLGKLLGKEQTGREQALVSALSLRAVSTSLATNARLREADFRLDHEALQQQLRAGAPAHVLPDQVRLPFYCLPQERGPLVPTHIGASEIAASLLNDQWQASWRAATEVGERRMPLASQMR